MRKWLVILIFGVLLACGKPDPALNSGTVVDKSYDDPDWIAPISTPGNDYETCTSDKYGSHCTTHHNPGIYIPGHEDPASWRIKVHGYDVKENNVTRWISVDETTYNSIKVGDHWER